MLATVSPMSSDPSSRRRPRGPYFAAGQVIKGLRLRLGLSQTLLAQRYGASQGYMSSVENGFENILGSGADWYQRMADALEVEVTELMQALGVSFVVGAESDQLFNVDTSQGTYVTVVLTVTSNAPDAPSLIAPVPVPATLAQKDLSAHYVQDSHIAVLPSQVYAIYSAAIPAPDDVVAFTYPDGSGRELIYFGYYAEGGEVELDTPLSVRLPLRLKPARILGVLETFTASIRPRRPNSPS